ncbi:TerD family protein [Streptomyces sp. NPDC001948]
MTAELVRGQNHTLPQTRLEIRVSAGTPVVAGATLGDENGTVRGTEWIAHPGSPQLPGLEVSRQAAADHRLAVDLDALPASVHRVTVLLALPTGVGGPVRFGAVASPFVAVTGLDGTEIATFTLTGLDSESAVAALELYRRQGAWKVRAVGQGYAGGLDAMLADQGLPRAAELAHSIQDAVTRAMARSVAPPPPRTPDADRVAPGAGAPAARTLAAVHTATPPAALHDTVTFEHPLWDPVPLETHLGLSTAQRRILGELHTDEDLRSRGRLIRDRVQRRSVPCHGDARTANFCVVAPRTPVLIDWETAGWGSPAGDLAALCGSLFADLLVGTAAPAGTGSRASSRASLAAAVERWTASVRAALAEYRHAAGACPDAEGLLGPAVGCALLVRAFVRAAYTTYDRQVACLYEIGASLLRAPERWRTIDVQR